MINLLSYVGMSQQSEVCLWTLLGLLRTIFDATLFRVNANLKQVWQMNMPPELSMPVQRVLRTLISGVMLVQCFSVYVYIASYIVLLYPIFLEERPTLVLPWLLLAAIRRFLCELTSLAMGLGTCVLLGPARPPCIKFLISKTASITPAFYMWMLIYSYYNTLKVASAFKTFPNMLQSSDHDYGLELAVRRRRTKSLFGEEHLRRRLTATIFNGELRNLNTISPATAEIEPTNSNTRLSNVPNVIELENVKPANENVSNAVDLEKEKPTNENVSSAVEIEKEKPANENVSRATELETAKATDQNLPIFVELEKVKSENQKELKIENTDVKMDMDIFRLMSNLGTFEDWCGNEVTLPRDTDRIMEQFTLMLLRISAFQRSGGTDPSKILNSSSPCLASSGMPFSSMDQCTTLNNEDTEPPPIVGTNKARTASYVQEYPQIFMKKVSDTLQRTPDQVLGGNRTTSNLRIQDTLNSSNLIKQSIELTMDENEFGVTASSKLSSSSKINSKKLQKSTSINEFKLSEDYEPVVKNIDLQAEPATEIQSSYDTNKIIAETQDAPKKDEIPAVAKVIEIDLKSIKSVPSTIKLQDSSSLLIKEIGLRLKGSATNIKEKVETVKSSVTSRIEKKVQISKTSATNINETEPSNLHTSATSIASHDSIASIITRMKDTLTQSQNRKTVGGDIGTLRPPTDSQPSRSRDVQNNRIRNSHSYNDSKKSKQ